MEIVIHYWNVCVIWTLCIWSSKLHFLFMFMKLKKKNLVYLSFANEKLIIKIINDLYFDMKKKIPNMELPNKLISLIITVFFLEVPFSQHTKGDFLKNQLQTSKLATSFYASFLFRELPSIFNFQIRIDILSTL